MMVPVSAGSHTIKIGYINSGPVIRIGKQFSEVNSETCFIVITRQDALAILKILLLSIKI